MKSGRIICRVRYTKETFNCMITMTRPGRSPKIALYSHDTMGLGHVRRNLLIARALAAPPLKANVLLIAGVHEAGGFSMPPGVDCLTLPAYRKDRRGIYTTRSLGLEADNLKSLRSGTIDAALNSFAPDLFIVDNVPKGALEELTPVLDRLKHEGRTRCVLGLRDILDEPDEVRRQWRQLGNEQAIRDYYEAIWIYGDHAIYDAVTEYGFAPDLAARTIFTGYLDQATRLTPTEADAGSGNEWAARVNNGPRRNPFTLCVIGGGQDGAAVARAFSRTELPSGERGILMTGPFLPGSEKRRLMGLAAVNPRLEVLKFVPEPIGLMQRAERVIAMGGYNTVLEILSLGKRALVVPRDRPRLEQTIRARCLQALGLLDCIGVDQLNPRFLSEWLNADAPVAPARELIDFDGLKRIPELVAGLLDEQAVPRPQRIPFPVAVDHGGRKDDRAC